MEEEARIGNSVLVLGDARAASAVTLGRGERTALNAAAWPFEVKVGSCCCCFCGCCVTVRQDTRKGGRTDSAYFGSRIVEKVEREIRHTLTVQGCVSCYCVCVTVRASRSSQAKADRDTRLRSQCSDLKWMHSGSTWVGCNSASAQITVLDQIQRTMTPSRTLFSTLSISALGSLSLTNPSR